MPPQPHPLSTQEDIYNQQLGSITIGSCGAYLVSAIYSLPPDKRAHALTSLKVGRCAALSERNVVPNSPNPSVKQAWGSYVRPKEPRIATARILHTLQNLVGAVLSPTHCPLHHDAPAFALLRALPFPGRALVEHYTGGAMLTCPTQGVGLLRRLHRCTSLRELEKVLLLSIGRDGEDAAMADHYGDGMTVSVLSTLDLFWKRGQICVALLCFPHTRCSFLIPTLCTLIHIRRWTGS